MILIVSGVSSVPQDMHQQRDLQQHHFQQEMYQAQTKQQLKEKVEKDFGEMLKHEMSKLTIDVLI